MKRIFALFKQTWTEFSDDKAQRLGAALAYYTIFSLGPILLIAVSIAGLVFGKEAAQGRIGQELQGVFGANVATQLNTMIANAGKKGSGTIAMIIGIVTLLLGAAGVFGQLKDALNTIWNVEPKKSGGIMTTIRQRFLSMAMVLGVGFLLLVSLVIDAAISAMGHWISARFPGGEAVFQILQLIVSLAVITVLFAMIFRYLPDTKVEWRDVWLGAGFTGFLFVIGKFGLGLWLGKGSIGSAYGAAGSLVILLVWIYWSAQILFFGAEFTQVYANAHGSKVGERAAQLAAEKPKVVTVTRPVPVYAKAKSGGGAGKVAVGGVAGLFLGALVGG
ncbi:MAG TPA: YihY/virulence factor BrkB family protein, partial [Thermoanaerobaculia bacterium]|nr:YihY/virulence factor BrkB family protein [Thermoanaerobaculia bacterium]